jgi:hypothetical protein
MTDVVHCAGTLWDQDKGIPRDGVWWGLHPSNG